MIHNWFLWLQYSTTTTRNTLPKPVFGGGGGILWLIQVGGGGWSRHHSTLALVERGWSDVYSTHFTLENRVGGEGGEGGAMPLPSADLPGEGRYTHDFTLHPSTRSIQVTLHSFANALARLAVHALFGHFLV